MDYNNRSNAFNSLSLKLSLSDLSKMVIRNTVSDLILTRV
jgi:hypothetical protein